MKNIFKHFLAAVATILFFTACHKVDDLPSYGTGVPVQLSSSVSNVAPTPADSLSKVLAFSWTDPKYAQDPSLYKFVIEIDSTGRNFANKATRTVMGKLSDTLLAKELNAILLGFGFAFNTAYEIDVRVISSYNNNNEQMTSNTIKLNVTPYKVPPKIPVPPALYVVGDVNGWNNSPGLDTRYQLSLIDETTYAGIINFPGGGNYKLIQELGVWSSQFHMLPGGTSEAGEFEQRDADPGFPGPAAGWYRVTVNFQNGTYTVKPAPVRVTPPANLYLVGDVNGWNNSPGLDPIYKFTVSPTDPFVYTLDVTFTGTGNFKLIQELGVWSSQFHMIGGGLTPTTFGEFEQVDADPGFPAPGAGTYRVTVNFAANYYWITPL